MTREEFDRIGMMRGYGYVGEITDEDYKLIETVYTFHPAISEESGKEEIVDLVGKFGMCIIHDMLPRANQAAHLEDEIRACDRSHDHRAFSVLK